MTALWKLLCDSSFCRPRISIRGSALQSLWNISKIIKKTTTIKSEESSKNWRRVVFPIHYSFFFLFFEQNVQDKKMTTFVLDGPRRDRRDNIYIRLVRQWKVVLTLEFLPNTLTYPSFSGCERNPMVWPFKWNLFSTTFTWFYIFSM